MVTLEEIRAAAARIRDVVVRTPLLPFPELSQEFGGEVRLKCESLQRAGSFKARGATNFVSRLSPEELARGVITYSSGNHGQALAMAAGAKGVRAVVVLPTTAPRVKVEGAKRLGAEVVLEGTTSLHRQKRAEAIAESEGLTVVPPFDHPYIIAGQGSVGLEIVEDWPEVDLVLAPIGGGGLASGTATAIKHLLPGVEVVGVEASGAPSMRAALDAGHPVTLDGIDTIADGLAPVRTGDITFLHGEEYFDDVVLVDDAAIRDAASLLLARRKLVVEYSGAAPIAAILAGAVETRGRKVAAILSGGNLDPSLMEGLARRSE
ncbi:MAG: pyridoxal-phosphate dependent enzyme [Gemmatimonadetes bacterium]|nr:pyridoxal-phosphate dependent enzyme [Gemmatimonadota bacterium]